MTTKKTELTIDFYGLSILSIDHHEQSQYSVAEHQERREKNKRPNSVFIIPLVLVSLLSWISLKWNLKCIESITNKALFVCLFILLAAVYDKHDYCPAWAARDECRKSNWTWMRDNCPLSCHIPREYLVHPLYIFGQGEELITGQYTKQFTWSPENDLFKTFENINVMSILPLSIVELIVQSLNYRSFWSAILRKDERWKLPHTPDMHRLCILFRGSYSTRDVS